MSPFQYEALNELSSPDLRIAMDTFDDLASLGVGRVAPVPRIVVVGERSSGKSSVLAAVSGVPFPVQERTCSRFATELILGPSSLCYASAFVHFADGTLPKQLMSRLCFEHEDIYRLFNAAEEIIEASRGKEEFSRDVLRLTLKGPDIRPLVLVDLPGLPPTAPTKSSVENASAMMDFVGSYMKEPNTILLTVVSATRDLADQKVMQLASRHDPTRERTLGVITKPDLIPLGSYRQAEYLRLVMGQDLAQDLPLGWHVLRNRDTCRMTHGPRETIKKEFFHAGPWATIPEPNRGAASLRGKLSRALLNHVKKGVPDMIKHVQSKLIETQLQLDQLGPRRSSPEDMRSHLIGIASVFERLVHDGIRGHYSDPFYHSHAGENRRLRAQLRNLSKASRYALLTFGCSQQVTGRSGCWSRRESVPDDDLKLFLETYKYTADLPRPERVPWESFKPTLERYAAACRGTELPGYANTDVMTSLFQLQSEPWKRIAESHIKTALDVTKAFVEAIFAHIIGPVRSSHTTRAILSNVVDDYFDAKEQTLLVKVRELLRPYQDGYALPLDIDFHDALWQRGENDKSIRDALPEQGDTPGLPKKENGVDVEKMFDTTQVFYEMSLRTFTENLNNLAVESCLIQDLPNIFNVTLVCNMDTSQVEELAFESEEERASRLQLEDEVQKVEEVLERCRTSKKRMVFIGPPATQASSIQAMPLNPSNDASNVRPWRVEKGKLPQAGPRIDDEVPTASGTILPAAMKSYTPPKPAFFKQTAAPTPLFTFPSSAPPPQAPTQPPFPPPERPSDSPVSAFPNLGSPASGPSFSPWDSGSDSSFRTSSAFPSQPGNEGVFKWPTGATPAGPKAPGSGVEGLFTLKGRIPSNPFLEAILKGSNGDGPNGKDSKPSSST